MAVSSQKKLLATTDATLLDYPVAFLHGRRNFQFTPAQRKALANYVAAGGMVVADSICASEPFANAFRREMQLIFPEQPMQRVPLDHPLLTPEFRGFDIAQVTLRNPRLRTEGDPLRARLTQVAPLLEGIAVDGRYVVLFSPYDLSCALENQASLQCKGYTRADAAKIGINMLLYALQQ